MNIFTNYYQKNYILYINVRNISTIWMNSGIKELNQVQVFNILSMFVSGL